jgi:hypothetical protein
VYLHWQILKIWHDTSPALGPGTIHFNGLNPVFLWEPQGKDFKKLPSHQGCFLDNPH